MLDSVSFSGAKFIKGLYFDPVDGANLRYEMVRAEEPNRVRNSY